MTGRLDCATKDTNSHIAFKDADEFICLSSKDFQSMMQDLQEAK
jgi:hypothetical protein